MAEFLDGTEEGFVLFYLLPVSCRVVEFVGVDVPRPAPFRVVHPAVHQLGSVRVHLRTDNSIVSFILQRRDSVTESEIQLSFKKLLVLEISMTMKGTISTILSACIYIDPESI